MCLKAQPNEGHHALAELAKKKENFICLTQNVDGENKHFAPTPTVCRQTLTIRQACQAVPGTPQTGCVSYMGVSWI